MLWCRKWGKNEHGMMTQLVNLAVYHWKKYVCRPFQLLNMVFWSLPHLALAICLAGGRKGFVGAQQGSSHCYIWECEEWSQWSWKMVTGVLPPTRVPVTLLVSLAWQQDPPGCPGEQEQRSSSFSSSSFSSCCYCWSKGASIQMVIGSNGKLTILGQILIMHKRSKVTCQE